MIKKLLTILIISAGLSIIIINPIKADSDFIDIADGSWYEEHVEVLLNKGIIDGFPDGTFRPFDALSADQFIKMIVAALGYNPGNGKDYWALTYINYAEKTGLLENSEISDYTKPLSRGEIVCIISKAIDYLNESISIETCGLYDLYGYTPLKYVPCVLKTQNAGIITGYPDNTFGYDKHITRAEACAIIDRLINPVIRQKLQSASFTSLPVSYSYSEDQFIKTFNEYEGSNGCYFDQGIFSKNGVSLSSGFNKKINENVAQSIKLLLDNISFPTIDFISLSQNNVIQLGCFSNKKYSHNNEYAKFSIKFYDNPTGYNETQWGYDTMFLKIEINSLSNDGLVNKESGLPDVYYEYKIKSLMRILFGIEKGDGFSNFILDKYFQYSNYKAGSIPEGTGLLNINGTKMIFFCEGDSRKLCFTFSED